MLNFSTCKPRRSASSASITLVLEVEIAERLSVLVTDDERLQVLVPINVRERDLMSA
jgi:hypothetical protein